MAIWQSVAVPAEQAWAWTLGPLTLYLRRSGDELVRAVARAEDPDAAAEIQPLTSRRWCWWASRCCGFSRGSSGGWSPNASRPRAR